MPVMSAFFIVSSSSDLNCQYSIFSNAHIGFRQQPTNWCLSLRSKLPVIARPVRTLVVAIPRIEGKCIDYCPTERENLAIFGGNRYLVPWGRGIATEGLRTGSQ